LVDGVGRDHGHRVRDRLVRAVKDACERADVALPADIIEVDLRSDARETLAARGHRTG